MLEQVKERTEEQAVTETYRAPTKKETSSCFKSQKSDKLTKESLDLSNESNQGNEGKAEFQSETSSVRDASVILF